MKAIYLVLVALIGSFVFSATNLHASDEIYGGMIKNRKSGEVLALKCAELKAANDCVGFQFVSMPSEDADPNDWKILCNGYIFHDNDLTNLEKLAYIKMKFRVNPNGFAPPWFAGTMIVWNLIEENKHSTGKKLPLWILYGVAVPVDIATFLPIGIGTGGVFGVKRLVIAIQKANIRHAFDKLLIKGKTKILGNKNFNLIKNLIEVYPNVLN